jgi:hypothetical protein
VGNAITPRVKMRLAETRQDFDVISAGEGLPPLCFLASLGAAICTGACVYKSGPRRGFAVASCVTALTLLMLLWALSVSREPLGSIRLDDVQTVDIIYVSTFFLTIFFPLVSFGAWYLSTQDLRN